MATLPYNTPIDWLRIAAQEAAAGSHDMHTQNGAILVPRAAAYVCVGVNKVPAGIWASPDRLARPAKYEYIEHAERMAIYQAARVGTPTRGATLYCPWFACMDCARAIIVAGITEVVGHVRPRAATPERWTSSTNPSRRANQPGRGSAVGRRSGIGQPSESGADRQDSTPGECSRL